MMPLAAACEQIKKLDRRCGNVVTTIEISYLFFAARMNKVLEPFMQRVRFTLCL